MKIIKSLFLAGACIAFTLTAAAQINSPYSKYGYGLLNDNATSSQAQMGGIGYGMQSGRQINVMNPASYAAADTLTFLMDMGVDFSVIKQSDVNGKISQYGGGLDYITMKVPIGKRMGASLGLLPYSSVGYSFGSEIANGTNSREGQGGLNQLYIGYAAKLAKGLSAGFNFSYLFGNIVNDLYVYDTAGGSTSLFEQVMQVRDWKIQFGLQYGININPDNRISAGITFTPAKSLLGKAWVAQYDVNADVAPDTLATTRLHHQASLPSTWGAGLSYQWQKRLTLGVDFTYQPWSKAKVLDLKYFDTNKFADRWQLSVGGEFTPATRGNYFKTVSYRAGCFFNRDYIMVGNNHVRDFGLSFGLGLPALQSKTMINLGFEYRHRQAAPDPLLKENYFSIKLGLNFNELWFFQNKIR